MPAARPALTVTGKPWDEHIADVKYARSIMTALLTENGGTGLSTDDLRTLAVENGATPINTRF